MSRRKHKHPFWQEWAEVSRTAEIDEPEAGFDPEEAWRQHFTAFLGMPPEKHWLFKGRRFKPWFSGHRRHPGHFNPFVSVILSRGGGLLSIYVLHLLAEEPRYGNDIMRELAERTEGRWGSNPGAIYPLLTVMEKRGLIEGEWEDPDKRTRRIYRLLPPGRQELDRLKEVMRPKLEEAIRVLRRLHNDLDIEGG